MMYKHNEITNRIFDLSDEAEKMIDGEIDWDEDRLQAISQEMMKLQEELETL